MTKPLNAAVITEWHPFNVMDFQRLFVTLDGFNTYIQSLELLAQDEENYAAYDLLVFYNLSIPTPEEGDRRRCYLEQRLGEDGRGIVLLHHAIANYPKWPFWDDVSGIPDRRFKYFPDQGARYSVTSDGDHGVLEGIDDFNMTDETYTMEEPSADNEVVITTDHPNSMRAIAWTRLFKNSRVFCYQSGHDRSAYENPSFQQVLGRAMLWAAGRLQ